MEEPGDTPRKGPLLAQKMGGTSGTPAGAAASVPGTPSGSSVQLAGHNGASLGASAPGDPSGRGTPPYILCQSCTCIALLTPVERSADL